MNTCRKTMRWIAGLLMAGTLAVAAVAPAEAATASKSPGSSASAHHFRSPTDTGWNGT